MVASARRSVDGLDGDVPGSGADRPGDAPGSAAGPPEADPIDGDVRRPGAAPCPSSTATPASTPPMTVTDAHTAATPACTGVAALASGVMAGTLADRAARASRPVWAREAVASATVGDWARRRSATRMSRAGVSPSRGKRTDAHPNGGAPPSTVRPMSSAASRAEPPGRITTRSVELAENRRWAGSRATAKAAVRSSTAPTASGPGVVTAAVGRAAARTNASRAARARTTSSASADPTGPRVTTPAPTSHASSGAAAPSTALHIATLCGAPAPEGANPRSPGSCTDGKGTDRVPPCHQGKHASGAPRGPGPTHRDLGQPDPTSTTLRDTTFEKHDLRRRTPRWAPRSVPCSRPRPVDARRGRSRARRAGTRRCRGARGGARWRSEPWQRAPPP